LARIIFTLTLPDATGASRMVVHFIGAFRRKGYDVTVVHGNVPTDEKSILPELHDLGVETLHQPELAFPLSPTFVGKLAKLFAQRQPIAIVGVQQRDRSIAMQAANRIKVPGFISCQNTHVFGGRWPRNWLKERYYAWAMRKYPQLVVCSSPLVQREMIHRFGLSRERTHYLPNAVDLKQIVHLEPAKRQVLRNSFGVAPEDFMLVNVGRINRQKGQDLLLQAFAKLKPQERRLRLVLVGGVSKDAQQAAMEVYHSQLRALVKELSLTNHVTFAGWRTDVPDVLASADGYVHSARWEGFGIASFEGMAAQLPTIWTDCWGRPNGFVDGVHGWLVPTENVEALQNAMETLVNLTQSERQRIGVASRKYVEDNFDSTKISDEFVRLIEESLSATIAQKSVAKQET
jgi:glycosyltransferase involved in cell wall biosynthesis